MDCPPIPPNCIQFQKSGNSLIDSFNTPAGYVALITIHNNSYWRPIIAAVARCAWLDFAMKCNKTLDSVDADTPNLEMVCGDLNSAASDAFNNAEAWSVWGLKQ